MSSNGNIALKAYNITISEVNCGGFLYEVNDIETESHWRGTNLWTISKIYELSIVKCKLNFEEPVNYFRTTRIWVTNDRLLNIPVVSKTSKKNVKTVDPKQNLKRIRWRNVTTPSDRTFKKTNKTPQSKLLTLDYFIIQFRTYLLAVSPLDSVHDVEELSEVFLSRSAIFTLLLMTGLSRIG